MKKALIAGATGLVGSELLRLMIWSDEYEKIHVLARTKPEIASEKVDYHVMDFDKMETLQLDRPVDHVFCCLGTTIKKAKTKENFRKVDYDYVVKLATKSMEWNASKFLVISSLGAHANSAIFYSRVKGEMEKALRRLGLSRLFIFRPSLLIGERNEVRAGEKTAIRVYRFLDPLFIGRLRRYKGIAAEKVARAMLQTAVTNDQAFQIFESDEIQRF